MKRRTFLTAGITAFSSPALIRSVFAEEIIDEKEWREIISAYHRPSPTLEKTYQKARLSGQPLLIIVVPETDEGQRLRSESAKQKSDDTADASDRSLYRHDNAVMKDPKEEKLRWQRTNLIDQLVEYGEDQVFVDLGLAQIACATMTELRRLLPQAPEGEPWLVVVEQHAATPNAIGYQVNLPAPILTKEGLADKAAEEPIQQRVVSLSRVIHSALAADEAMITARAEARTAVQGKPLVAKIRAAISERSADVPLYAQGSAIGLEIANNPSTRQWLVETLAAYYWAKFRFGDIAGSYWHDGVSCTSFAEKEGFRFDNENSNNDVFSTCGIGAMPEPSKRFLDRYTSSQPWLSEYDYFTGKE